MSKSILQESKQCYITGQTVPLHRHHIFAGSRRKISEREGFWVYLAPWLHNGSEQGVHGRDGHELDLRLKQECQAAYEKEHSRQEWMALMRKNYL